MVDFAAYAAAMSYWLRSKNTEPTISEIEPASEQALGLVVDDDGPIVRRTSSVPQQRDEAA